MKCKVMTAFNVNICDWRGGRGEAEDVIMKKIRTYAIKEVAKRHKLEIKFTS